MDAETKKLIEESLELARDNNKILRRMRRGQRISSIFRLFYWLMILGIALGAYYYIQPYFSQAQKAYQNISEGLGNLPDVSNLNKVFNQIGGGKTPE
ncbi:hypothetical protein A3I25_01140 [Candidatus Nomurabacteria bacterium RIFCSPLOWO2_02_FULL_42_17]|uniref:Uncharacterized protein n=1 Tax=Candidatus Nomurabacteria bacterium RIFCSPLOWO2_02_FULL_42_17 TaxID=1801789 RepID=A0A1F6XSD2_9BACT|nr:MAG: hypothetical protein A3I25_01140 [Candidatus Nomurabacteria bacterium RIFCSPLOWO2_02_FULL_42_17]